MAVEIFAKLTPDVKGESITKGFEGQLELLNIGWSMTQTGTTHRGTGGGAGKVDVHDLQIAKYVDTASANIISATCRGKHFDSVVITVRKAGETPLDYMKFTLKNVIITSYSLNGSQGADLLSETFSLNFEEYEVAYQAQDAKGGKAGGEITAKYNIAKNE